MLFTELALIRWITANNVFVTEATNFVLLASFLGIGIGFLNTRSGRDYLRWTPVTLLALVAFVLTFPVILRNPSGRTPFLGVAHMPALPRPVSFTGVFLLTVAVDGGPRAGGRTGLRRLPPAECLPAGHPGQHRGHHAVLGPVLRRPAARHLGVVAGAGLAGLLLPKIQWWQAVAVAGAVALLAIESFTTGQIWSPYNKLVVQKQGGNPDIINVTANNIPFQTIHSVARMRKRQRVYFFAYRHVTPSSLSNVLIIGAGTGNDVAVALAEGARHIDAVEIDPRLLTVGRQEHPNHPYQSPRVTAFVADGRQYLQDTSKRYSLILFGLPDSLTALAGQSGIRLESYLLTEQSVAAARAHLAPGGTFAMYNWYAPFVLDQYATTIEDAFHRTPVHRTRRPGGGPARGGPHRGAWWPGPALCQLLARHAHSSSYGRPAISVLA